MENQVKIPTVSKVVHAQDDKLSKYSYEEDGKIYWLASWYASILGYASLKSFMPTIRKAERISLYLGIPIEDNFDRCIVDDVQDIKLTRFACMIIALQADIRKPVVKRARSFFLQEAKGLNKLLGSQEYMQRMVEREQLTGLHKVLNSRARAAGVRNYRYFQNEGYLGMYKLTSAELKSKRGLSQKEDLNDQIGAVELAANIFRITMTIERLKLIRNPSEEKAAAAHWRVGSQVRQLVKDNTGLYPEELRISTDLDELQKTFKSRQKRINSLK